MPDKFEVIDIEYKSKVKQLDAFLYMPVFVSGDVENEKERLKINEKQEVYFKQKGKSWKYEEECRLILSSPFPWLFGEQIEYSNQERLFHYEPSQLVGIVYGARMSPEKCKHIEEILKERKEWYHYQSNYKRIIFNFMEFKSKLSFNQREVEIIPYRLDTVKPIYYGGKDFDRLYNDWITGVGFEREGNSSKRIKVD